MSENRPEELPRDEAIENLVAILCALIASYISEVPSVFPEDGVEALLSASARLSVSYNYIAKRQGLSFMSRGNWLSYCRSQWDEADARAALEPNDTEAAWKAFLGGGPPVH